MAGKSKDHMICFGVWTPDYNQADINLASAQGALEERRHRVSSSPHHQKWPITVLLTTSFDSEWVNQGVLGMMECQTWKYFLTSSSTFGLGSSVGPNLAMGWPSLSITNLVKFHLMAFIKKPPCLSFRKTQRGWASPPFTLILLNMSNVTLYFSVPM